MFGNSLFETFVNAAIMGTCYWVGSKNGEYHALKSLEDKIRQDEIESLKLQIHALKKRHEEES